jgi:glycosyltransferase involved in cell wall biosynthesis
MPTVSVILPTFNRTKYLRLAVESVYAQTYTDWEMIIADDGSSEETQSYLRGIASSQVRTIWLRHSGNPSHVRNAAIAAADCRYLAFLDSDDTWAPSKLERQVAALRCRAHCRWSYTACDRIDENGRPLTNERLRTLVLREGWIFEPLLKLQISVAMPSVMAHRNVMEEVGGFDEQQRFGEFHDLCLRLALKGEVVALRDPLCSVRAHGEHYSADRVSALVSWMRLYEKMRDLAPSVELRSQCARMRAQTSLRLAQLQRANGDHRAAWMTLQAAAAFSWPYPHWWYGLAKSVVRSTLPTLFVSRRRRQ